MSAHNYKGNCWHKKVAYRRGELNDVCNWHDEPRGDCSSCAKCPKCLEMLKGESSYPTKAKP